MSQANQRVVVSNIILKSNHAFHWKQPQGQIPYQLGDVLAELDVDAAVAEAELLESVGGAEVCLVLGALPGGGARLEAPEGPLVVERDGGRRDGVAEEARGQVRADLERRGGVLGAGDRDRAGAGAQRQRRRRRPPPHGSKGAALLFPASLSSAARCSEEFGRAGFVSDGIRVPTRSVPWFYRRSDATYGVTIHKVKCSI